MIAVALVARLKKVPMSALLDTHGRTRGRTAGSDRQRVACLRQALYLASVGGNLSRHALQRVTSLHNSTVMVHLRAVEDARELRAELDALLDEMAARVQLIGQVLTAEAA